MKSGTIALTLFLQFLTSRKKKNQLSRIIFLAREDTPSEAAKSTAGKRIYLQPSLKTAKTLSGIICKNGITNNLSPPETCCSSRKCIPGTKDPIRLCHNDRHNGQYHLHQGIHLIEPLPAPMAHAQHSRDDESYRPKYRLTGSRTAERFHHFL